jgi:hypothetical protein
MNEFDEILDQCIDRVLSGESIKDCLASYPELAEELEPLLRMAQSVANAASVEPRAEFKAAARHRFHQALSQRGQKAPKRRLSLWGWQPRWVGALALIFLSLFLGTGAVVASQDSMPNDVLYPVKRGWEQVELVLIRDGTERASQHLVFAQRRLDEVEGLTRQGKEVPGWLLKDLGDETDKAAEFVEKASLDGSEAGQGGDSERWEQQRTELVDKLVTLTERQQAVLQRVYDSAPEQAQEALQLAVERSRRGHQRASEALQRIHVPGPPEITPGPPDRDRTPGPPERDHTPGPSGQTPAPPVTTPGPPERTPGPPERTPGPPEREHTLGPPETTPGRPQ